MSDRLKADEVALLVQMLMTGKPLGDSADNLGIHPKRRDRIADRWLPRKWADPRGFINGRARSISEGLTEGLTRSIEADNANGSNTTLAEVLAELASRNVRHHVAEDRHPNARDLVCAALVDVEWRLDRGRRQRRRSKRRQLREARWLFQRAMAVLCGAVHEEGYLSPNHGAHMDDTDGVDWHRKPTPMPATDRTRGAGELYRRTLGGMR